MAQKSPKLKWPPNGLEMWLKRHENSPNIMRKRCQNDPKMTTDRPQNWSKITTKQPQRPSWYQNSPTESSWSDAKRPQNTKNAAKNVQERNGYEKPQMLYKKKTTQPEIWANQVFDPDVKWRFWHQKRVISRAIRVRLTRFLHGSIALSVLFKIGFRVSIHFIDPPQMTGFCPKKAQKPPKR